MEGGNLEARYPTPKYRAYRLSADEDVEERKKICCSLFTLPHHQQPRQLKRLETAGQLPNMYLSISNPTADIAEMFWKWPRGPVPVTEIERRVMTHPKFVVQAVALTKQRRHPKNARRTPRNKLTNFGRLKVWEQHQKCVQVRMYTLLNTCGWLKS